MGNGDDLFLGDATIIVQNLVENVEKKTNDNNKLPSIYMAPSTLRNLSPSSFEPRVVSIGPLHRDDAHLQAFEGRKAGFVHDLFIRLKCPKEQTIQTCVKEVYTSIERIKGCYDTLKLSDNELTKMMVMDSCFILEFIHQISELHDSNSKIMWLDNQIPYDLVLLENQVPFFVLNIIFKCTTLQTRSNVSLTEFIHPLLNFPNLFQERELFGNIRPNTTPDHILGLLRHFYEPRRDVSSYFPSSTIHPVVELDCAGVSFEPHLDMDWPMAMELKMNKFSCFSWSWIKPTLKMPALRINHFTELVLRNLIAYEQSSVVPPYVTSYAMAMDMLIDSKEDIAMLVESKVLFNHIGSNEEAANMINKLCKELVWVNFFYGEQWVKLDEHCNSYWRRKIFKLKRTYFTSPWSFIALCAAFVLFVLSVVQTIYTVNPIGS